MSASNNAASAAGASGTTAAAAKKRTPLSGSTAEKKRTPLSASTAALASRYGALSLGGTLQRRASSTPAAPSSGARKLLKAQERELNGILAAMQRAGPENYVKDTHYAWYVWPTTKEGISDPAGAAVKGVADVSFVLSNQPTLDAWTSILANFALAIRARKSRRCIPGIDHGRIEYFLTEWSSDLYRAACAAQPDFLKALKEFETAWKAV